MIIKPARHKRCPACKREVQWIPAVEGCDGCGKQFAPDATKLDVKVFHRDAAKDTDHLYFCCWKCVIKFIRRVKSDYFVTLPFLTFEPAPKGQRFEDFLKLLK